MTTKPARSHWNTIWRITITAAIAVMMSSQLAASPSHAATEIVEPPPPSVIVDGGGGNQTNPSVDGDLVVYTDQADGSHIRYRSLAGGPSGVVPNPHGLQHHFPSIDGTRIVFTEVGGAGANRVMVFDVARPEVPPAAAGGPGLNGRLPALGANTLVFQDLSFAAYPYGTEISVLDLATGVTTRVTDDGAVDTSPDVSPNGETIVWAKCTGGNTGCDVWTASKTDGWLPRAVTGGPPEEDRPTVDNTTIVYTTRAGGPTPVQDIRAVPIGGGLERTLNPGAHVRYANITRGVVTADALRPDAGNYDVLVWDLASDQYRFVTATPESEFLNESFLGDDGLLRVVWAVFNSDSDIMATTLRMGGVVATSLVAQPVLRRGEGNAKSERALEARLTRSDTGAGVPAATITFRAGADVVCVEATDATGLARCGGQAAFAAAVRNGGYTAVFAGQPGAFAASEASGARVG